MFPILEQRQSLLSLQPEVFDERAMMFMLLLKLIDAFANGKSNDEGALKFGKRSDNMSMYDIPTDPMAGGYE